MSKTGSCLCGAVTYTVTAPLSEAGACHCGMCRKWSGGIYIGMQINPDDVSFEGVENLSTYTSSDWAERAFCSTCGSNLYYRVTAPGPHHGTLHMGLGSVDDPSGITMNAEIFTDTKPDAYAFSGDLHRMTGAEVFAMFSDDSTPE